MGAYSYNDSGTSKRLSPTQVTNPPKYMREGSLSHYIKWINWQKTCGPHAEWYVSQGNMMQRNRQTQDAKEQIQNCLQ